MRTPHSSSRLLRTDYAVPPFANSTVHRMCWIPPPRPPLRHCPQLHCRRRAVPPATARFAGTAAALAALLGVLVAAHEAQRQQRALESRKAEVLASRKAEPEVRAPRAGGSAKHGGGRVGGCGA